VNGRSIVDRLGALSGVVYFVLVFIGNTLATSGGPGDTPTGEQARAELQRQANSAAVNIGFAMELLGMVAFLVFVAYLYGVLRRAEGSGGWLAVMALVGGLVEMAIKLGSADVIGAAFYNRNSLSPELAKVLIDVNSMDFVVSWLPFGMFIAGAAASMLTSRVVGRGFGWAGLLLGVACIAVVVVPGVELQHATPVPFLLATLWVVAISVRLAVRAPRADATLAATPAVAATA
jgi:hypothetical protein